MEWIGCVRCKKNSDAISWHELVLKFGLFSTEFPKATKQYRIHPNGMINAPKSQFRVQWSGSGAFLKKIPTRFRGTNFCTSSARCVPIFVRQPNSPECAQIVRNAPKHQHRVYWGVSGAFVAKNSEANSWHELLHQFGLF